MRRHAKAIVATSAMLLTLALGTGAASAATTVTIEPVSAHTITTAEVEGSVTTDAGASETFYFFQYRRTDEAAEWTNGAFQGPLGPGVTENVSETLTGLRAKTPYEVRLVALPFSDFVEVFSSTESFETDPAPNTPSLVLDPATPAYTTAQISGTVDPEGGNLNGPGEPVPLHWELQLSETGKAGTFFNVGENDITGTDAEESVAVPVEAELAFLNPSTTYFHRLIVTYAGLEVKAGIATFETKAVSAPSATIDEATSITTESAHFSGTVTPGDADPAFNSSCRFEWVTDAQFDGVGGPGGFAQAKQIACEPNPANGAGPVAVSADPVSGIEPFTAHHLRLRAENPGGATFAEAPTFLTPSALPVIQSTSASDISSTQATLRATIKAGGPEATYRFEYVTEAQFEEDAFAEATSTPETSLGATDNSPRKAAALLSGLDPDTVYRYRVLAANSIGNTTGADRALRTFALPGAGSGNCANSGPGVGFLPDCRAWEMVSPRDKNGGDVVPKGKRTRAALTGGAVTFTSLQGFGDIQGMSVAGEYLAQRDGAPGTNGWSTHAITPRQEPMTYFDHLVVGEPKYLWQMSADLTKGVFQTSNTLTEDPYVAGLLNYFLRDDLRTPGSSSYRLLTTCPACESAEPPTPIPPTTFNFFTPLALGGASEDFGHVLLETARDLTSDAPPNGLNKVYENDHGTVRLVGILPSGVPASGSVPGGGVLGPTKYTNHPISNDGSRIAFTGTDPVNGLLFQRIDHTTTIPLNLSERAVPDAPQGARYWDQATDGSRVFFTTNEALTEDASTNSAEPGGGNLYMWAKQPTDEEQSVAVDASGGSFKLTFNEQSTAPIAFNASASAVQSALETLKGPGEFDQPVIGAGNVTVSGGPGSPGAASPYEIIFNGNFSGANVAQLEADGSTLSGGASTATVATTNPVNNLTYLSTDPNGPDLGAQVEGAIGSSDDGRYVYFVTVGPKRVLPGTPGDGPAIYLWHDGEISYVGELVRWVFDSTVILNGSNFGLGEKQARVTPDGRHLLFPATSGQGLFSAHGGTDYDHGDNNNGELYVYSAPTDELHCASCNPSGAAATASATAFIEVNSGAAQSTANLNHPISEDGRHVFFSTAERLVSADTNGATDAYVYDTLSEEPNLLSSGRSPQPSYFIDASADGTDAYFTTSERLSGWDVDGGVDLYDARLGGGFPEPPPPTPSCQGDACQPAPPNLNDPTPSSSSFKGPGDESRGRKPRTRCAKGKRRVKTRGKSRCVKKKRQKRDAKANRRAGR